LGNKNNSINNLDRRSLAKVMSFWDFFFLAFGIYAGVAWVTTLGGWLQYGPLAAMIGFCVCGILILPIGFAYAELTPALPLSGGEVVFAYKAFGRKTASFTGWFIALAYIIVCPYEAISVSIVLNYMFPGLNIIPLWTIVGYTVYLPTVIIGCIFSIFFTMLNYKGVKQAKIFQTLTSACVIIMVTGFFVAALSTGSSQNLQPLFSPKEGKLVSIFAVLGMAPFFLAGFESIPQAAEEAKEGLNPRMISKAIILAITVGIVFYCITTLSVALVAPWQSTVDKALPTAYAFEQVLGPKCRIIVLSAALLGLLSTWNGCFMTGSRILFAMGRGRLLPKFFGEVHPKYKTPQKAVLFTGLISMIGPFIGKSGLIPAVHVGALAFIVAWLVVSISVVKLRKTHPKMKRPYVMPGGITMGWIAVIVCIFLMGLILIPGAPAALVWPVEWVTLLIWIIIGAILFKINNDEARKDNILDEDQAYLILGEYK